ncbi:hypothetical protein Tco_1193911 [Tanacetum coccineum]
MLNVGSTVGSFNKQALETELSQLKDALTLVRIQLDSYKLSGKISSRFTASEKPKVLASGMYTNSSKYIPPPKRANWVKSTPLPKKKQVTFQEPPKTSYRPTQKPPVQQNKKPNVSVNLNCVNARRAADHNRKLNVVDHNQFVIRSLKSVNTKTPHAKHSVNHTKKVWKATRNHNVNTTKTAWRPTGKVVGSVKPQWKPTGRHFALYDNCPLTRIMEPIVEPLELTPSVSSSSKVTMISRFTDCKLSDRKAGSKGLSEETSSKLYIDSKDMSLLRTKDQRNGKDKVKEDQSSIREVKLNKSTDQDQSSYQNSEDHDQGVNVELRKCTTSEVPTAIQHRAKETMSVNFS